MGTMQPFDLYESALTPVRARFLGSPAVTEILSPEIPPPLLESFLIHFCARGVAVTEPVEGWIRRAGEACLAVGLEALGGALVRHSLDEAGHDRLFAADARLLVERWNAAGRPRLDVDELLALPPSPGARHYRHLHESTIAGAAPYAQMAIEFEIESLAMSLGEGLLRNARGRLGDGVLEGLSFLREHVELDVGHTRFNRRNLTRVLDEHPEFLPAMEAAGTEVLQAYGEFLADCLEAARPLRVPAR
jgi:hypothetical protein